MAQAVIFDFDGVIVDTEPLYWQAADAVLAEMRLDKTTPEETALMMGHPRGFQLVLEKRGFSKEENDAIRVRRRELMAGLTAETPAMAGVRPLLSGLRERRMPIGMATASYRKIVDKLLDSLALAEYFSALVAFEDVSERKPHPEAYLRAAALLNKEPRQCVAIEDSPLGIASAKAAGCTVIGVRNASDIAPQNLWAAHHIVESLEEIQVEWLATL